MPYNLSYRIYIMRLINNHPNNHPINHLISLNISRNQFGLAKNLLHFGEKLRLTEQKLNFLKKCKSDKIFPRFIESNVRLNDEILFPADSTPRSVLQHFKQLNSTVLRHAITRSYLDISQNKYHIVTSKEKLQEAMSQPLYNKVLAVFEENNTAVKYSQKENFKLKHDWLVKKYYSHSPHPVPDNTTPIDEPVDSRVTTVTVELEDCEKLLLRRHVI